MTDSQGNRLIDFHYEGYGAGYYTSYDTEKAALLAQINPFGYRSYVMDLGTGFYYLQSRYYDPTLGRFINADVFLATGQGLLGNNMFTYCNNNPAVYFDYAGLYPLQAAVELLNTWLFGDSSKQSYSESSRITKVLKKSEKMQSYVDTAIDNYKSGQSKTKGSGEFTRSEDGNELYLSTQHFEYSITVTEEHRTRGAWFWKREQSRYVATVVVSDKYNFDKLRAWDGFGNIMNNIAYLYSAYGEGNDYEWTATYTYATKWTTSD